MISAISTTDRYILQPTLLSKHKKTLEWLSAAVHWKIELCLFPRASLPIRPGSSGGRRQKTT
jgi:hypothetical protein